MRYFCAVSLFASLALANGITTISGRERGLWTTQGSFVIVATIESVERMAEGDATHRLTLVPHATLAGTFDVSLHPRIVAPVCAEVHGTSVHTVPEPGSLGIVVMTPHEGELWIDSAMIGFVPGNSALTVVEGWHDPRIAQTLERIQIARGVRPPATQPTTDPVPVWRPAPSPRWVPVEPDEAAEAQHPKPQR